MPRKIRLEITTIVDIPLDDGLNSDANRILASELEKASATPEIFLRMHGASLEVQGVVIDDDDADLDCLSRHTRKDLN